MHGSVVLNVPGVRSTGPEQPPETPQFKRSTRGGAAPYVAAVVGLAVAALLWQGRAPAASAPERSAMTAGLEIQAGASPYGFLAADSTQNGVFGLIGDVALATDRTAYVLDVMFKRVAVFSPSGEQTATLGREGRGPGELMGPVALAVDGGGNLFVLDEMNQRIEVFSGADGAWVRLFPVDFHPYDMCFLDGRLYVLGARNGYVIHEVSPRDGAVVRSFAPDPASRDRLLAGYRARGYLACGPGDEITFLPSLRPDVVRFSGTSGAVLDTTPIPGFQGIRVTYPRPGAVTFEAIGRKRNHYASSVVVLPGGDRLIQIGLLRPRSPTDHEFESILSYRLSGADGRILRLGDQIPRVIAAHGDSLYSVQTDPFPAVSVIAPPGQEKGR